MTALQTSHSKEFVLQPFDSILVSMVKTKLLSSCYDEVREVGVRLSGREIILEGIVSSFYLKQVTQTVVRDIAGKVEIRNNVSVAYPETNKGE